MLAVGTRTVPGNVAGLFRKSSEKDNTKKK